MNKRIEIDSFDVLYSELVDILSDLLVVPHDEIEPHSLLVDDLDADSVSFLELSYIINERFGIQMAEVKVDEETLNMNLVDGLERLNQLEGDTTFFEHVKSEAIRRLLTIHDTAGDVAEMIGVPVPGKHQPSTPVSEIPLRDLSEFGLEANWDTVDPSMLDKSFIDALPDIDIDTFFPSETKERLFRSQRVENLVEGIQGRVPDDMRPETKLNELMTRDLFRFLTVGSMARYLWDLYKASEQADSV